MSEPSGRYSSLDVVPRTLTAALPAVQRVGASFSGVRNRLARRVTVSVLREMADVSATVRSRSN